MIELSHQLVVKEGRQVVKHDLGLEAFWLAMLQIQQAEHIAILIHDDSALLSGDGRLKISLLARSGGTWSPVQENS